jgi:hypothetical protein
VALTAGTKVATLTVKQINAINRLGRSGWLVDLNDFSVQRDGMLEGWMATGQTEGKMFVGIHPDGSTHT